MASYNKVILVGNLTRDVELRHIPSGTAVTDISLAVNDRVKKNNEWVDETTFVDITLWGRTAEIAGEYLRKCSSCLIEGRLQLDSWEKDGQKRTKLKVVGDKMQMLGGKQPQQQQSTPPTPPPGQYSQPVSMPPNEEIPF